MAVAQLRFLRRRRTLLAVTCYFFWHRVAKIPCSEASKPRGSVRETGVNGEWREMCCPGHRQASPALLQRVVTGNLSIRVADAALLANELAEDGAAIAGERVKVWRRDERADNRFEAEAIVHRVVQTKVWVDPCVQVCGCDGGVHPRRHHRGRRLRARAEKLFLFHSRRENFAGEFRMEMWR